MDDIERQIERWRRDLPASLAGRPDVIDELEEHLRDAMTRLIADATPADEAWAKALERLGPPDALASEFAKVPRVRWLPGTVVLAVYLAAGLGVAGMVVFRVLSGNADLLLAAHVLTVSWGYLAALAAGALAVWALTQWRSIRDGQYGRAFRRAAGGLAWASLSMTAVGVLLGAVWASGHLGRTWGWDSREIGGLAVLSCAGLAVVASRRGPRAGMTAALAGSTAVVLAWFGPLLLDAQAGGGAGSRVVLGAVVLGVVAGAQLVGMALAIAVPQFPVATRGT